jgi:hypothetical protein
MFPGIGSFSLLSGDLLHPPKPGQLNLHHTCLWKLALEVRILTRAVEELVPFFLIIRWHPKK